MKMTTMGRSIFLATALFIGSHAISFEASAAFTLPDAKCEILRSEYDKLAQRYGERNKIVRLVKAVLDRYCPVQPPQEILSECTVFDPLFINVVSLEVTPSNTFSNSPTSGNKVACMSELACGTTVYTKFFGNGPIPSTRCNDGDPAVVRLTDAEVQSIINATP